MTTTITRAEVGTIPTPEATDTWQPIPHETLLTTVQRSVELSPFSIERERYEVDGKEGARLFAVWNLVNGTASSEYRMSLGIRNAHDKAFAAGMAMGAWVLVCSNLQFGGEYSFGRKHTSRILIDLPDLVAGIVGKLSSYRDAQDRRIESYRRTALAEHQVHDIVIRSVDAGVMANSYIAKVLEEWRVPAHDEWAPRNAWSLFNAYTEVFKGTNTFDLPRRTQRLHSLMDTVATSEGNDPNQIIVELPEPTTAVVPYGAYLN